MPVLCSTRSLASIGAKVWTEGCTGALTATGIATGTGSSGSNVSAAAARVSSLTSGDITGADITGAPKPPAGGALLEGREFSCNGGTGGRGDFGPGEPGTRRTGCI